MFAVYVLTLRNVLTYLLYDCDKIMLLQNFTTGGLSSLLHCNFVQDFVIYLYTFVTNAVKNFACGGLSSLLYFNFVHDFIRCLCANCDKCCKKKFHLRRAFVTPVFQFRLRFRYLYDIFHFE